MVDATFRFTCELQPALFRDRRHLNQRTGQKTPALRIGAVPIKRRGHGAACFVAKTVFNPRDMPALTAPSQSAEDYLERIHELIEAKGYARVVDIASSLKVRQASVTSMVQKLARAGFVKYEKYRGLILTNEGRKVALTIQHRHATLSRFFSLFGLDAEIQRADIEGIEHHLSPDTLAMLADLATFFEGSPEALRAFKQSRKRRK